MCLFGRCQIYSGGGDSSVSLWCIPLVYIYTGPRAGDGVSGTTRVNFEICQGSLEFRLYLHFSELFYRYMYVCMMEIVARTGSGLIEKGGISYGRF